MSIKLTLSTHAVAEKERAEKVANPGFGKYYTDHMVVAEWTEADGWGQAELKAYAPISLDPAAMVFITDKKYLRALRLIANPMDLLHSLDQKPMLRALQEVRTV